MSTFQAEKRVLQPMNP